MRAATASRRRLRSWTASSFAWAWACFPASRCGALGVRRGHCSRARGRPRPSPPVRRQPFAVFLLAVRLGLPRGGAQAWRACSRRVGRGWCGRSPARSTASTRRLRRSTSSWATRSRARSRSAAARLSADLGGRVRLLAPVACLSACRSDCCNSARRTRSSSVGPLGLLRLQLRRTHAASPGCTCCSRISASLPAEFDRLVELLDLLPLPGDLLLQVAGLAGQQRDLGLDRLDDAVGGVGASPQFGQLHLGDRDLFGERAELLAEFAEFALPRDEPGLGLRRPDGERAVGLEQFAGARDDATTGMCTRSAARRRASPRGERCRVAAREGRGVRS